MMVLSITVVSVVGFALVMSENRGNWPEDWPKELEGLRDTSRTIELAAADQQTVYEIPFKERVMFERLWPVILKLKTPGAPLTLYRTHSGPIPGMAPHLSNETPCVRLWTPVGGRLLRAGDEIAAGGGPLPPEIVGTNGELPEYVAAAEIDGKRTWVPVDLDGGFHGFMQRVRVDIDLVVDGEIIDLNHIPLPPDTPISDNRFKEGHSRADADDSE